MEGVEERLATARQALALGAELAREARRRGGTRSWFKPDGSPACEVDVEVESLLRTRIRERFPTDGFSGEESGRTAGSSGFDWCCDPLDGTWAFLNGESTVAITAVVVKAGEPVLSVVRNVFTGEVFEWSVKRSAAGAATPRELARAVVNVRVGRRTAADLGPIAEAWAEGRIGKVVVLGGSLAYGMALVARGDHDLLCGRIGDGSAADVLAGRALVEGAGGTVSSTRAPQGGVWLMASLTAEIQQSLLAALAGRLGL